MRYVKAETAKPLPDFMPFVSVIVPCRGLDQGLKENLTKLFKQDYPSYEIVFVTGNETDESLKVIEELRSEFQKNDSRIVIAGCATDSGQKVHNLRQAIKEISEQSQAIVFVDSDARPSEKWLKNLVTPLSDKTIGAATGYRWFVVARGSFSSHLRAVWNASITSQLGVNEKKNFCWGGSTAIRRETFERLNVSEKWRGVVSDDFALTRILQEANLPIHFVPQCLTASIEDCSFRELIEFTTRQIKITRTYSPNLWKMALIGNLIFTAVFFTGIILVIANAVLGNSFVIPLIIVTVIFLLGVGKAWLRLKAVSLVLTDYKKELRRNALAQLTLWVISSVLFLFNTIAAGFSRRIIWRGIKYELKSPTETVIISSTQTGKISTNLEAGK